MLKKICTALFVFLAFQQTGFAAPSTGSTSSSSSGLTFSDLQDKTKGYTANRQAAAEKIKGQIKDSGSALTTPGEMQYGNDFGGVASTFAEYLEKDIANITMCNGPNPKHTMEQLMAGTYTTHTTVGNSFITWDHYYGIPSGMCIIIIPLWYITLVFIKDNIEYYDPGTIVTTSNKYFADRLLPEPAVTAMLPALKSLQKSEFSLLKGDMQLDAAKVNIGMQAMGATQGTIQMQEADQQTFDNAKKLHDTVVDSDEKLRFLGTQETGGFGRIRLNLENLVILEGSDDVPHSRLQPYHTPDILPGFIFTKHTILSDFANLMATGSSVGKNTINSVLAMMNPFQCVAQNKTAGGDGKTRFPSDLLPRAMAYSGGKLCLPNIGFTYRPLELMGYEARSDRFSAATDSAQKFYEQLHKLSLTPESYTRDFDHDKFMALEGISAGEIKLGGDQSSNAPPATGASTCVLQKEAHHPPIEIPRGNRGELGSYDYNAVSTYEVFRGCYSAKENDKWPVIRYPISQVLPKNFRFK